MNKELAKTLTTALVQFIDRERPEGSMCCSSYACEKIEEAFEEGRFDVVENYTKKQLSRLTEFEYSLRQVLVEALSGEMPTSSSGSMSWAVAISDDEIKKLAPRILALSKKHLLSYADESNPAIEAMADLERTFECNPDKLPLWLKDEIEKIRLEARAEGYSDGLQRALEANKMCESYHFPTVTVRPLCWEPGGTCTNPQMDCINCPRKTSGGMPNTASGTSTAKAE